MLTLSQTDANMATCRHCSVTFTAYQKEEFCCSGCEFVYQMLNHQGLEDYYKIRDSNPPTCPLPVQSTSETYEYCDDPTFISKMSIDGSRMTFYLEGLNCTACLWLLEKLPSICPAAAESRVNMSTSTIDVLKSPTGNFSSIAKVLNQLGYHPHTVSNKEDIQKLKQKENHRDLIRIGVAAAATGNIMILAVSLYGGASDEFAVLFRWLTAALAFPVLTYCALPFYKNSWSAIKNRHLNIDVPIVAALVAGSIFSIWGLYNQTESLYFDSLSTLVLLLLSSRYWLKRVQQNHLDADHLEDYLLYGTVTRFKNSSKEKEKVSTLSLEPGDLVEMGANMVVPADGLVRGSTALIHNAVMSGESTPQSLAQGSSVEAGAKSLNSLWWLEVTHRPSDSRIAKILREAERSTNAKPQIVQLADQVAQWFIGLILLLAVVVFMAFLSSNPKEGLARALALVIVTCPCVFGMAIPLSMSLAIRQAARKGVVIKAASALERIASINQIYFDKTGTLTFGELRVHRLLYEQKNRQHLLAAQALELDQPHPIGKAILQALKPLNLESVIAKDIKIIPTGGITGIVNGDSYSIRPIESEESAAKTSSSKIKAKYILFHRDEAVASFEVGDELRPDAFGIIQWAKENKLKIRILSGDQRQVVYECGQALGLTSSELIPLATPEMKANIVRETSSHAMMVGDGVNDAAALAAASLGVAVKGSMDVSLRSADIYLTRPHLMALADVFEIAKRTRHAIWRNLIFSGGFNLISGSLALSGFMSPLLAAILMPLSSIIVLVSSLLTAKGLDSLNQDGNQRGLNK